MRINVHAKPGKKEDKINFSEGIYLVQLRERAEKGKANLSLIKLLAKHFNVSTADIRIIKGLSSHKKIVEIKE